MKKHFLLWLIIILSLPSNARQSSFSTAGFYQLPHTGREVFSMNVAWRFYKGDVKGTPYLNSFDDSKWNVVSLPHGSEYLPVDDCGNINYQGVTWYRKHFTLNNELKGKKLFLHFEAIMGKCKVWVNGKQLVKHFGGYLPIVADITSTVDFDQENIITVLADNSNDPTYPPGKPQDLLGFAYFGGIYRDCWLIAHNNVYITDPNYENETAGGGLLVAYPKVNQSEASVFVKLHIRNTNRTPFAGTVQYELIDKTGKKIASLSQKVKVATKAASSVQETIVVKRPMLWNPEHPYLYKLNVYIKDTKGKTVDGYQRRIGVRSIEFKQKNGLFINGKPYGKPLLGGNRHQEFAVVGNAVPNIVHWRDAKKMRDAGMEIVRNAHYPQDPAFMDACDELGLFVIVNTPGWQFWNKEPIFEQRVLSDISQMIRRDRNHPSVFLWEPILNETYYPSSFAKNATEVTQKEFPYPNSMGACDDGADGAKYYSVLLRPREKLDSTKTYLVREWGDNVDDWNAQNSNSRVYRGLGEQPMLIQTEHYARMMKSMVFDVPKQRIGGCLWHTFDHQQDYHPTPFYGGIMDAFRQPKFSYYMFMAQRDTVKRDELFETGPMVYIAHEMTPFSPTDVTVYSNCDEVRLTFLKNGKQWSYTKKKNDGEIPSPIIVFDDAFDFYACKAMSRAGKHDEVFLYAEGLINGKVVATDKRQPSLRPDRLRLRVDDEGTGLIANGSDFVTIIAELVDKDGRVKRLANSAVKFSVEGQGRIIGDERIQANPRNISWGSAPALIQSTTIPGMIHIKARFLYEGSTMPLNGEIKLYTREDPMPAIYSEKEANQIVKNKPTNDDSDDKENKKDAQALKDHELKLKEVEQQQSSFGVGIND